MTSKDTKFDQHNGLLVQVSCYRSTRRRRWYRNIRAGSSSDSCEALLENARECYKSVSQSESKDCKVRNFAK